MEITNPGEPVPLYYGEGPDRKLVGSAIAHVTPEGIVIEGILDDGTTITGIKTARALGFEIPPLSFSRDGVGFHFSSVEPPLRIDFEMVRSQPTIRHKD